MEWRERVDRFHFNDHTILNNQIDAITGIESDVLVNNGHRLLFDETQAPKPKLDSKTREIHRLQKPRTKDAMDLDGSAQDRAGELIELRIVDKHAEESANGAPVTEASAILKSSARPADWSADSAGW